MMKENKMLKMVAKVSEHTAIKQAGIVSRFVIHQPKTPARLLKKSK